MQQHYTAEPGTSSGTSIPSGGVGASRIQESPGEVGASAPSAGTMPDTGKSMSHLGHRLFQSPGMTGWCHGDRWMDRKVPTQRGTQPAPIPDGKSSWSIPEHPFAKNPEGLGAATFGGLQVASHGGDQSSGGGTKQDYSLSFHMALGMVPRRLLPGFRVRCGLSQGLSWCPPPHGQDKAQCPPVQGLVSPRTRLGVSWDRDQRPPFPWPRKRLSVPQGRSWCLPGHFLMFKDSVVSVGPPSPAPFLSPPRVWQGVGTSPPVEFLKKAFFQVFPRFLSLLHVAWLDFGKMPECS